MKNFQFPISNFQKRFCVILIIFIICLFLFKALTSSFFFKRKDRINLVIYGKYPVFYSLGLNDQVNYQMRFYPDFEIEIPGGLGNYRIGALGKFVALEKKPELFKKVFSQATYSYLDSYFYHKNEIFYGGDDPSAQIELLDYKTFLTYSSNINLIDRLFFITQFVGKKKQDFINLFPKAGNEFIKSYGGYFYQKNFRTEKNNLQIIYKKSYKTAEMIGNIIEGNGIRIVDISQKDLSSGKCEVWENSDKFSQTAVGVADFFQCSLKKKQAEISDIILILGSLEKTWEIK